MKERIYGFMNALLTNIFFYRLYYFFYRSRVGDPVRLPLRRDDFFFDGYPRSGNTFAINMIRHVLEIDKTKYASHLHSIAGLKMALSMKLNPIVIIRHPKDAIASYYFTRSSADASLNMQLLKRLTHQYTSYYQLVYKKRASIKIIQFDYATKNEHAFIKDIAEWLKHPEMDDASIELRIKSYEELMKEKEGEKDIRISALPNKSRSKSTAATKEQLEASPDFKDALSIYEKISKYL